MKIAAKDCFGAYTVMEGRGEFVEHWVFKNGARMRRVVNPKHIVPLTHAYVEFKPKKSKVKETPTGGWRAKIWGRH